MAYLDDIYAVLQVAPTGVPTYVRLSQNENGRRMIFSVAGGEIPSGSTATISGTKPDGVVYSAACTISGSTVTVNETVQLTAAAGEWDAKIRITNGGNVIATGRVRFVIDADTVDPGAVPSDSELEGLVAEAAGWAEDAKSAAYGSPLKAAIVAEMTDKTRVYVYTGSESGYTFGNWYFWNGSAWTSGGVYNSTAVQTDKTLSIPGMAADAEAVGKADSALKADLKNRITIMAQPSDFRFVANEQLVFSVDAVASSAISYQWQFKRRTDNEWSDFYNEKSSTMTKTWLSWWDGYVVRCRLSTADAVCYTVPFVGYLLNNPRLYADNFENGGFTVDANHQIVKNGNGEIRTIAPFYVESQTTLTAKDGYLLSTAAYNLDFTYAGSQGYAQSLTLQSSYYVYIKVKKADDSTVYARDVKNMLETDTLDKARYQSVLSMHSVRNTGEVLTGERADKYIYTAVSVGGVVGFSEQTATGYTYTIVPCAEGDEFTITGLGGTAASVWAFVDGNNKLISKSQSTLLISETVVAPNGAAKMIINSRYDYGYAWAKGRFNALSNNTREKLISQATISSTPNGIVSPIVSSMTEIKDSAACIAKGAIFKNGNAFCVTYGENLDGTTDDYPRVTSTGVLAIKYKYFQLVDGKETNVQHGTIAQKGTAYLDYTGASQTFSGGCGLPSGNHGKQFFTAAYTGAHTYNGIANYGMTPCCCDVTVNEFGVTVGIIKEFTLSIDGTTGKFDVTRLSELNVNYGLYLTTAPPYYDASGWKWVIPVIGGFVYVESEDAVNWVYVKTIKTPYQPACEVTSVFMNNMVVYAARAQWQSVPNGDHTYIGAFNPTNGNVIFEYRLESKGARAFIAKNGSNLLLFYNSKNRNQCDVLRITPNTEQLFFEKWFSLTAKCTWYTSCYQDDVEKHLYMVGSNNSVDANNGMTMLVMALPTNEPKDISSLSYSFEGGENYGAYIVDSALGDIAYFADGADDVPVKRVVFNIPYTSGGLNGITANFAGKNLFHVTGTTRTINGVTFTVNDDGTVKASGTASGNAIFQLASNFALKKGRYILSGCPAGGGDSKYRIDAIVSGGMSVFDYGDGKEFACESDTTFAYSRIIIWSGQTVDLLFSPMIRVADEADGTFEAYNGNQIHVVFGTTVYGGEYNMTTGIVESIYDASGGIMSAPTSIYVDAYEIKSKFKCNAIWASGVTANVLYRADTKLYIDKKLS